jgi:hypothetical protein
MDAKEHKIQQIFTEKRKYLIPAYQRPYSWNTENASELLQDITDAIDNKLKEYFIGSVIVIGKGDEIYEVVDGQQRLTTITIILSVIRDLIGSDGIVNDLPGTVDKSGIQQDLQNRVLPTHPYTGKREEPRLAVRKQDQIVFLEHILLGKKVEKKDSFTDSQLNLVNNRQAIVDFFQGFTTRKLAEYANFMLEHIYLVFVNTGNFDSAFRLFNVLNARGLPLSNGDLIKNQLFAIASDDKNQQEMIEQRWNQLEDITGLTGLDDFLSHHRTALKGNNAQNSLQKEFEAILKSYAQPVSDFCMELVESAQNYSKIKNYVNKEYKDFWGIADRKYLQSLFNVSNDEWIPPLLAFLNKPVDGVSQEAFLTLLEKITYQNWIRRLGKSKRNTVYYNLISQIIQGTTAKDIFATFTSFANNDDFKSLIASDAYGTPYAKAVLLRIETELQDNSVEKVFHGTVSVEHVLPQTMTDEYWKLRFSAESHGRLVHKLGNLALLSGSKNSAAQNYSLPKKQEIYSKRNNNVSFDLTKEICNAHEWTEEVIEQRQQKLTEICINTWSISEDDNIALAA